MEYYTKLLLDIDRVTAVGLSIQPRSPLLSEVTAAIRMLAQENERMRAALLELTDVSERCDDLCGLVREIARSALGEKQ
jgi:hypothetical protein